MKTFAGIPPLFNRFKYNNKGSFALTWAISLTTILISIGAGFDYAQATKAQAKSQAIADSVALSAAIFVKNNGGKSPTSSDIDAYQEGIIYRADEIGYTYNGMLRDMGANVEVRVNYNDVDGEALVNVSGVTVPAFMQLVGLRDIPFQAESLVKYEETNVSNPVSVFFVLDNSNSMNVADQPGNPPVFKSRVSGLTESLTQFNQTLTELIASNNSEAPRIVRTALVGYNDNINNLTVNPTWGALPASTINNMSRSLRNGTNSAIAMDQARQWMNLEDVAHERENPDVTPKKFVIFMTDGANTQRSPTCKNYDLPAHRHYVRRSNRQRIRHELPNNERLHRLWIEVSTPPVTECLRGSTRDLPTINDCNAMKNNYDTEIYTIGYALEPGQYRRRRNPVPQNVSIEESVIAYDLLRSCASSPDHFLVAEDADALNEQFKNIAVSIAESTIRIAQ